MLDPPFPSIVDLRVDELQGGAHLFDRLRRDEMHGVRVRKAFDPSIVAAAVARLEERAFDVKSASAPPEGDPVQLFGLPVQWAAPDLERYLVAATQFREAIPTLWGPLDYEERIRDVLGSLSANRPLDIMRSADGSRYTPSTIRRIAPRGGIPPHVERHQLDFPGCAELREKIDGDALMSFFTLLSPAASGGLLELHAMTVDDFARTPEAASGQRELRAALSQHRRGYIHLDVGDLLVFNSGRYFHAVTPVEGDRNRWTIGGFLAPNREHDRVLYWG